MPENVTTEYTYDKAGNILTQTDGKGNVTGYEYTAFGRVESVKYADGNAESYEYDAFGNVIEKTDGNGTVVSYVYDNRNNLTRVSYDDKIITYRYDSMNNRTSMTDESGTYVYTYDSGNRLTKIATVTYDDEGYEIDRQSYMDYVYDKLGNVTKANHLTYTYDVCSRMTSANNVTYTYDENGNLATTTYPTGSVTYTYDANNRVTNVANKVGEEALTSYAYTYYDNGMEKSKDDGVKVVEYVYDGAGRLKTVVETEKATEAVTRTATYTYDKAGNRMSLVEVCTGTETVNGDSITFAQKRTEYLYNKANVITLESEIYKDAVGSEIASKNTRYVYDKAGNLISTTAEYVTEIPEEVTEDATEATEATETATEAPDDIKIGTAVWIEVTINEYNGLNQLVGYTSIEGDERSYSSYVYNGDNLRVQKTVDGEVTDYVLNGGYVIAETGKTYLLGLNYHGFDDNAAYWYFANSHGDITRVVDSSNATVSKYDYDEFGELTYEESSIDNDILYAGEFYDRESENYYLRARYYNPSIGRFNSKDPHWNPSNMIYGEFVKINTMNYKNAEQVIEERIKVIAQNNYYKIHYPSVSAILQSSNLYVYCINNPLNYVDPLGLFSSGDKLVYGSSDEDNADHDVLNLQLRLVTYGYLNISDISSSYGEFNWKTFEAVNRYKEDNGLTNTGQYYGVVGETTWSHLDLPVMQEGTYITNVNTPTDKQVEGEYIAAYALEKLYSSTQDVPIVMNSVPQTWNINQFTYATTYYEEIGNVMKEEEIVTFFAKALDIYYAFASSVDEAQGLEAYGPGIYFGTIAISFIINLGPECIKLDTDSPNMEKLVKMQLSEYYEEQKIEAVYRFIDVFCSPLRYVINPDETVYGNYGYVLTNTLTDIDALQDDIRNDETLDQETKMSALMYMENVMEANLIPEIKDYY